MTTSAPRSLAWALLCIAASFASCSSSSRRTLIQVSPSDASLYINGKRVGNGDKLPYLLSFDDAERVYVQATRSGFVPETKVYTQAEIDSINETVQVLKITLRERTR